jgi:hypothetical protein
MNNNDFKPREKSAMIAWKLAQGQSLRTCDVARLIDIQWLSALRLMYDLSRVLPIYLDDNKEWRKTDIA